MDVIGRVTEVAVHHHEVVAGTAAERGPHGAAQACVLVVVVNDHPGVRGRELVGERTGAVAAAVIDDDELPPVAVVERAEIAV